MFKIIIYLLICIFYLVDEVDYYKKREEDRKYEDFEKKAMLKINVRKGLREAKRKGKKHGKPRKFSNEQARNLNIRWKCFKGSLYKFCKTYNLPRTTVINYLPGGRMYSELKKEV